MACCVAAPINKESNDGVSDPGHPRYRTKSMSLVESSEKAVGKTALLIVFNEVVMGTITG
jgi:hypothetical protein